MFTEQLLLSGDIVLAKDTPMTINQMVRYLNESLHLESRRVNFGNKYGIEILVGDRKFILLIAAITYLGKPHPIYKKRVQLKNWWLDALKSRTYKDHLFLFMGVYKFNDTVIFVNFEKEDYKNNKLNNSSAHVHVVDLYHSIERGIFSKQDYKGNTITTIRSDKFHTFLEKYEEDHKSLLVIKPDSESTLEYSSFQNNSFDGQVNFLLTTFSKDEVDIFRNLVCINKKINFRKDLTAREAISQMYDHKWKHWKQGEWPAFYLEYIFSFLNKSIDKEECIIRYLDREKYLRTENIGDFDLYFPQLDFYGDLKASSRNVDDVIGNDSHSVYRSIQSNERFWYVVYEHTTEKDNPDRDYPSTRWRNDFIAEKTETSNLYPLSYKQRMKSSISFSRMFILEINKINKEHIIGVFKQGKQPDGSARKEKVKFTKSMIENSIIFSWDPNRE